MRSHHVRTARAGRAAPHGYPTRLRPSEIILGAAAALVLLTLLLRGLSGA